MSESRVSAGEVQALREAMARIGVYINDERAHEAVRQGVRAARTSPTEEVSRERLAWIVHDNVCGCRGGRPCEAPDQEHYDAADALLPRIREHIAEAWDEGYEVGCADTPWEDGATEADRTPNPYREADHG